MALNQHTEIYRLYRNPNVKATDNFFLDLPNYICEVVIEQNTYNSKLYVMSIHLVDSFGIRNIHRIDIRYQETQDSLSFYGVAGGEKTIKVDSVYKGIDAILSAATTVVYEVLHYVPKGLEARKEKEKARLFISMCSKNPEQKEMLRQILRQTGFDFSTIRVYRYNVDGDERFELYCDPHRNAYMFTLRQDSCKEYLSCQLYRTQYKFMLNGRTVDVMTLVRAAAVLMKIHQHKHGDVNE